MLCATTLISVCFFLLFFVFLGHCYKKMYKIYNLRCFTEINRFGIQNMIKYVKY